MQQNKRPVTAKDIALFHLVGDVQMSPDGALVAYTVQTTDLEKNKTRTCIWVVSTDGGAPRRLTNPASGSDRSPRWSPDGKTLAFVSDRGGKPQIWLIETDGGEARCLETKERPGAPVWSPDGKHLAFTASAFVKPADWAPYPGAPEGDRKRAEEFASYEPSPEKKGEGPSAVKAISRLKYRMDGVGYFGDKRSHIFVLPADGSGKARRISDGDYDHQSLTWRPDSRAVVCCAHRDERADHYNRSDIWSFDIESGAAIRVYEHVGPATAPRISPDGRYLLFCGHEREYRDSTQTQAWVVPLEGGVATGRAVSLTGHLDRSVGGLLASDVRAGFAAPSAEWAGDSRSIYFLLADRGESHLFRMPVTGGKPTRLTSGEERTVSDFSLAAGGQVAMLISDSITTEDVYVLDGHEERRLTNQNPSLEELALVRPERFTYKGADGWPVDAWVMKPIEFEEGKRYPTVLAIHGGPHGAYGTGLQWSFQTLASAGFAVLYTNPRGSVSYGQEFALAVIKDWGGKDYEDVMAGVDAAVASGVADPERLGVMGWSYGGYLAAWTVTRTDRFKAAVSGAPVINHYSLWGNGDIYLTGEWHWGGPPWTEEGARQLLSRSPVRYADNVVTPTMVVCGEADMRCHIEQAEQFYLALKRLEKAPSVFIRYPGEYHGIGKPQHKVDRYERYQAWFQHYLG